MSKTVETPKGTKLPLTNLKGKDYLMVAYRLQWLTEEVANYEIETELVLLTDEQTVARATIKLLDKEGKLVKKAQATKRETKKDFPDHTEKAETAAIGRALAMLGFGTQHAISDLDEGQRLADSPLVNTKTSLAVKTESSFAHGSVSAATTEEPKQVTNGAVINGNSGFKPNGKGMKNLSW